MSQSVNVISLGMVNAFLIKGENLILVDTGFENHYDKILTYLESHHIDPKHIKLIVLTHNHSDHVSNLLRIQALTGAKVVVHESAYASLASGLSAPVEPTTLSAKVIFSLFGFLRPDEFVKYDSDHVFKESFDLNDFGVKGKLVHTPGHTDCSISVLLETGEAIVGDMIVGKNRRAKSHAKLHHIALNPDQRLNSLSRLLDAGAQKFYTSHGQPCSADAVRELIEKV